MSKETLVRHHEIWKRKPLLRAIYSDWYAEIGQWLPSGVIVEVGGGSGNLKESFPRVISADLIALPWLDVVLDAHRLPFASGSLDALVLFDVVHHLENPAMFLDEALRALKPGGRLVCMEPYVSAASYLIYRFFHPEPMDLSIDPFRVVAPNPARQPFDANEAIPTLLFERQALRLEQKFPGFRLLAFKRLAFFAYPLSGGFERRALIPLRLYPALRRLEQWLAAAAKLLAFRCLTVLEKRP